MKTTRIEKYKPEDDDALIAGHIELQEIESHFTDTRQLGYEVAEKYHRKVLKNVAENFRA